MIVDDQKFAIENIVNMIDWESSGFKIIATAFNGKQALAKFKQFQPQVIITDIKMPIMDGIELIQNIREMNQNIKVLLLTSYSDFSYAKNAIQYGATDYLIKNEINKEIILEKLIYLKNIIESESRISLMLTQKGIYDYFNSEVVKPENALSDKKLLYTPYYYLIIEEDMALPICGEFYDNQSKHTDSEIMDFITSIHDNDIAQVAASIIGDNRVLLIIQIENGLSLYSDKGLVSIYAQKTRQAFINCFQSSFTIYTISNKMNLFEMKNQYLKYQKKILAKYLFGVGKIYDFLDVITTEFIDKKVPFDERVLVDSIERLDSNEIQRQIDELFDQVLPPKNNYSGLKYLSMKLYALLIKYMESLPEYANKTDLSISRNYRQWLCGDDIRRWFVKCFKELIVERKKLYESCYSNVIIRALNYIHENYNNSSITINLIADYVYMSAGRLCVLFKQQTGKTINDVLSEVRVARAKELLDSGELKVYEVSTAVGYKTSQYFSQIFHKLTGVYPNEYRKREERNENQIN